MHVWSILTRPLGGVECTDKLLSSDQVKALPAEAFRGPSEAFCGRRALLDAAAAVEARAAAAFAAAQPGGEWLAWA